MLAVVVFFVLLKVVVLLPAAALTVTVPLMEWHTHVTSDMQKQACGIVGGFMEDIFGKELKPWQESEKPETEP